MISEIEKNICGFITRLQIISGRFSLMADHTEVQDTAVSLFTRIDKLISMLELLPETTFNETIIFPTVKNTVAEPKSSFESKSEKSTKRKAPSIDPDMNESELSQLDLSCDQIKSEPESFTEEGTDMDSLQLKHEQAGDFDVHDDTDDYDFEDDCSNDENAADDHDVNPDQDGTSGFVEPQKSSQKDDVRPETNIDIEQAIASGSGNSGLLPTDPMLINEPETKRFKPVSGDTASRLANIMTGPDSDGNIPRLADDKSSGQAYKNSAAAVKQTRWSVNLLKEWLVETGQSPAFEDLPVVTLGRLFADFYAALAPQKDAKSYSKSSYRVIRNSIGRYLTSPPFNRSICIHKDKEFRFANKVYLGLMKKLRKRGIETSPHQPITEEDLQEMYANTFTTNTPWGLLYKVFFEVAYYFARIGADRLQSLTKDSFILQTDSAGVESVTMAVNERQGYNNKTIDQQRVMVATGTKNCPVASFKKYIDKLNDASEAFFQQPHLNWKVNSSVWYSHKPIGKNSLAGMMKTISIRAGLSQMYTNHCVKCTTIKSTIFI